VHKGQGRRPLLDAHGLQALKWHRVTHRHDSVTDITKWAQENFHKPLSVITIRRAKAHLKWTVSKWKSVLWSDESTFDILVGNHRCRVLQAKEEGDFSACHQRLVQKISLWYGGEKVHTVWVCM